MRDIKIQAATLFAFLNSRPTTQSKFNPPSIYNADRLCVACISLHSSPNVAYNTKPSANVRWWHSGVRAREYSFALRVISKPNLQLHFNIKYCLYMRIKRMVPSYVCIEIFLFEIPAWELCVCDEHETDVSKRIEFLCQRRMYYAHVQYYIVWHIQSETCEHWCVLCMYILSIPTQLSNIYTYVSLAIHCYAFYTFSYPPPICSVCAPHRRCYTRKQHNIQRYDASAQPSLSPYHFFSCYNIVYMRIECDDEARRVIFVRCCSMRAVHMKVDLTCYAVWGRITSTI